MLKQYYVNNMAQANGDYEVHVNTCTYFSSMQNRTYLGSFTICQEAVLAAKKIHTQVNGCKICAIYCHTQ